VNRLILAFIFIGIISSAALAEEYTVKKEHIWIFTEEEMKKILSNHMGQKFCGEVSFRDQVSNFRIESPRTFELRVTETKECGGTK
jgi:hypothetical protein